MPKNSVKLSELVDITKLEIVHKSTDYNQIEIQKSDLNRPGLQLSGYMEEFPYHRLQIIGKVEYKYIQSLSQHLQYERIRGLLSYDIPAVVFSYDQQLNKDILDLANYYNKTILRSKKSTTKLISVINQSLEKLLADTISIHGELLDVYGMGVLIKGKSSVGKSEVALDLLTRGHRLVADDVVEITAYDDRLVGESPENIRHYMEIRGLGIIDIKTLYGVRSVKKTSSVDMVVELEKWKEDYEYDRLGLDSNFIEILGIKIPTILIPVRAGRNISMIIETSVINQRLKNMGHNSAIELTDRLINEQSKNN